MSVSDACLSDWTIQEADLAGDLVVDGEIY